MQHWLDGLEPAWTLLTFESLQALRHEPAATRTAIRIANDLSCDEIARSPIARNTLILLRAAIAHDGLPLTATGNLTRAVVAKMCTLMASPDYDQADAFRFSKVINEPDYCRWTPHVNSFRQRVWCARSMESWPRRRWVNPLLSEARQGSLLAILFHLAFWHMDLGYFGRGLLGSWPQKDAGVVLWSLSACANEWQSAEKLTRLCTIPGAGHAFWCVGQKPLRHGGQNPPTAALVRVTGATQRKDTKQSVRRPPFLSKGTVV